MVPSVITSSPSRAAKLAALFLLSVQACGVRAADPNPPQAAWLDVRSNGREEGSTLVLRSDTATYVALDDLAEWGVRVDRLASIEIDGRRYASLGNVPGVHYSVDEQTQELVIEVAPDRLQRQTFGLQPRQLGAIARSGSGAFVNYDVSGEHVADMSTAGAALEVGAFSPMGSGTSTFVSRWSSGGRVTVKRLETSWTLDDPDRMRSLRLGDSITRAGVGGDPFRFGGIQFGRSFDVQPGFITLPLPAVGGQATLPSVVDIYVNNVLAGHQAVQPGPFEINDVPIVTGSGDIQLVVRDMLGRQTVVQQPYYASTDLLRGGLSDYSAEAGFVRRDFGTRNFAYGAPFASGTYRYGLSNSVTVSAHAELSPAVQQGGAGADAVVPGVGSLRVAAGVSRSQAGVGETTSIGVERRTPRLSYGAILELLSEDYVSVGSVDAPLHPKYSVQAFAGIPFGFASLGLSYTLRGYRGLDDLSILGASAMVRLGQLGTVSVSASEILSRERNTAIQLTLSVPLGARESASVGGSLDDGRLSARADYQHSLPLGAGIGYRVSASAGANNRIDAEIGAQTGFGRYAAQAVWNNGSLDERLSASGSVGVIDGHLFAARRVTQSFAEVNVGGFAGVRIYDENQLVGRTGKNGTLIVPDLRDFDSNSLRLETSDLPMNAQVETDQVSIRPGRRTGVTLDFGVRRTVDAVVIIKLADGSPLPAGTIVKIEGGPAEISAPGGAVYLAGLGSTNIVTAALAGGVCGFSFSLPPHAGIQPRLGPFTCRRSQ